MSDIAKKYNYNDELLSMITFIYVAFYMDFGKDIDFPLYDLFNRVKIIYEEGNVSEISNRHGYGKKRNYRNRVIRQTRPADKNTDRQTRK